MDKRLSKLTIMLLLVCSLCLIFSPTSFAAWQDNSEDGSKGQVEKMDSHSPDPYNLGRYVRLVPVVIYHNGDAILAEDKMAIDLREATWLWGTQWTGKKYGVSDSDSDVNALTETYLLIVDGDLNTATLLPDKDFRLTYFKAGHQPAFNFRTESSDGYDTMPARGPVPALEEFHEQKAGVNQAIINEFDLLASFEKTQTNTYGEEYLRLVGQGDKPMSALYSNFDNTENTNETYKEANSMPPYYDKWQPKYDQDGNVTNREEAFAPDKSFYRGSRWSNKLGIAGNNKATLEVPGQIVTVFENVDLIATTIGEYVNLEPGTTANVKIKATNYSELPVQGTNLRWCENDNKYNWKSVAEDINLDPWESKEYSISVPVKEAPYSIIAKVNQEEDAPAIETDYGNNVATATIIPVQKVPETPAPPPAVSGNLKLTAKGQGGQNVYGDYIAPAQRPAGTAKWTDIVTATLTAQRPPVPSASSIKLKGGGSDGVYENSVTIVDYHISSATLSVPKKHPNFTFGNPIELNPMQYNSVSMPTGSRTSTQTFKEDWSMAGAKIYSQIQKRILADQPKYYSIKANYTVRYKVQWSEYRTVCTDSGCFNVYNGTYEEWRTANYSASANLLVNGTAVNSLAQ